MSRYADSMELQRRAIETDVGLHAVGGGEIDLLLVIDAGDEPASSLVAKRDGGSAFTAEFHLQRPVLQDKCNAVEAEAQVPDLVLSQQGRRDPRRQRNVLYFRHRDT